MNKWKKEHWLTEWQRDKLDDMENRLTLYGGWCLDNKHSAMDGRSGWWTDRRCQGGRTVRWLAGTETGRQTDNRQTGWAARWLMFDWIDERWTDGFGPCDNYHLPSHPLHRLKVGTPWDIEILWKIRVKATSRYLTACIVHYSTVEQSTVQYSTVQYGTAHYSSVV